MAKKSNLRSTSSLSLRLAAMAVLVAVLWRFPLFHVVPVAARVVPDIVNSRAIAEKFWAGRLAIAPAADAKIVATALRHDEAAAIRAFARTVGLGDTSYFFLRGEGRVVSRNRDTIQLALGNATDAPVVELQIGVIFGNTVRDSTGLFDVNQFSSLQDFNGLAAELNRLVEARVLPALREHARVGANVSFTGCAEAGGGVPSAPLLSIIPIQAEVH